MNATERMPSPSLLPPSHSVTSSPALTCDLATDSSELSNYQRSQATTNIARSNDFGRGWGKCWLQQSSFGTWHMVKSSAKVKYNNYCDEDANQKLLLSFSSQFSSRSLPQPHRNTALLHGGTIFFFFADLVYPRIRVSTMSHTPAAEQIVLFVGLFSLTLSTCGWRRHFQLWRWAHNLGGRQFEHHVS